MAINIVFAFTDENTTEPFNETTTVETITIEENIACDEVVLGLPGVISNVHESQIGCPASRADIDCLIAYVDENQCILKEWRESIAVFDCPMLEENDIIKCEAIAETDSNCCAELRTTPYTVETTTTIPIGITGLLIGSLADPFVSLIVIIGSMIIIYIIHRIVKYKEFRFK